MRNISNQAPESRFEKTVSELVRKVEELRTNQLNVFVVPRVATDPSSPVDGQMWINTTSNQLKIRMNGVTKVVTVT